MSCIAEIAYGEVVVTIHDTRVVQVERREKRRFDAVPAGKCAVRENRDRDRL
ncbi:YezD family protein [Chlorobaculum limnaeum]